MAMMAMAGGANWMASIPLTSFQLLLAAGVLLICAAVLLGLRRQTRVTVERSLLTDELMIYLGRIADALEHQRTPTTDDVTVAVMRRMEEVGNAKPNGKDWSSPLSVEVVEKLGRPGSCPMEFFNSAPRGAFAGLCEDDS